jgi:hypothetical protein
MENVLVRLIRYEIFSSEGVALESSSASMKHEYLTIPYIQKGACGAGKNAIVQYLRAWQKDNVCVWLGEFAVHFPFNILRC